MTAGGSILCRAMTEHSPAPWAFVGPPSNIHVVQADAPHMRVCFLTSNGPTEANARLIAAAPDLLSVARQWVALSGGVWDSERYHAEKRQLLADTAAAIARATGDQAG